MQLRVRDGSGIICALLFKRCSAGLFRLTPDCHPPALSTMTQWTEPPGKPHETSTFTWSFLCLSASPQTLSTSPLFAGLTVQVRLTSLLTLALSPQLRRSQVPWAPRCIFRVVSGGASKGSRAVSILVSLTVTGTLATFALGMLVCVGSCPSLFHLSKNKFLEYQLF